MTRWGPRAGGPKQRHTAGLKQNKRVDTNEELVTGGENKQKFTTERNKWERKAEVMLGQKWYSMQCVVIVTEYGTLHWCLTHKFWNPGPFGELHTFFTTCAQSMTLLNSHWCYMYIHTFVETLYTQIRSIVTLPNLLKKNRSSSNRA